MPRKNIPNSKMYQTTLPLAMHQRLHAEAEAAAQQGGQININKVLVQRIYNGMRLDLSATERKEIEAFIARL
jgi:hypothetical protein